MKDKPSVKSVRCPQCLEYELYSERENMVRDEVRKKWLHSHCYEPFMAEKEKKEKKQVRKDQLYNYICRLHSVKLNENSEGNREHIPTSFYSQVGKVSNEYDYDIILKGYELAKKDIDRVQRTKHFDKKIKEMIYCFAIVLGKLKDAEQKVIQEKRMKKIVDLDEQRMSEFKSRKVEYKKTVYEHDILDLFE